MESGIILYINRPKGYGFITPLGKDKRNKDNNLFFHHSKVVEPTFRELERGDLVDYKKTYRHKGDQAVDLVVHVNQRKKQNEQRMHQ